MTSLDSGSARANPWTRSVGIAITAAIIGVIELLDRTLFPVPGPMGITILGVAYAAFVGGMRPGMASAALLAIYAVYRYSIPGELLHFTAVGFSQVGLALVAPPIIVLMIGSLKRRSDRVNEALRIQVALEAQIAERSRVGRELKRERNEQQTIFHSVPAMIWFKDKDGRILRANRTAAQSIGRTVKEVEGRSTFELYPDEAPKYQQDDLEVIRSGQPKLGIVERYEVPGGEDRWVRTDKIPYRDAEGNIVGVIVFAVDITAQKEAQQALQKAHDELEHRVETRTAELVRVNESLSSEIAERSLAEEQRRLSEERLQQILDNSTAVMYVKDSAGRYVLVNRRFEDLFHTPREQLTGQTDYDVFPKDAADAFRINDRKVLESGSAVEFEEVVPHDDGVHIYISLKFPLFDFAGRPVAVCGISTDITERKKTEALLREHTSALEDANEALAAAREAAEAANRAKSRFLANISHEIRTPIMAMLGAAELLQSDRIGRTDRVDRSDMILRNGRHLLSLVDELLDVSRIEAGKLEIRPGDCSLVDILADVEAITEPLRRKNKLDYRVEFETPIPNRLRTDRTRLTQALINLVNNAFKFTEDGYVRVRVRVDRDAPEPRLTIAVEDTGIGVRPEDQERIFDSFTQVEPISRGAAAGVGLGLPIARWIAEKLGGKLEVQSAYGRGTTFTLRIATGPLHGVSWMEPAEAFGRRTVSASPLARRGVVRRLAGRILLAEDAGDTRELIAHVLTRSGAEVTTVENGRQAVDAAGRGTFDLILMDIRMPELDGLSAAGELRRRGCRSPLIALTASTSERERILASGFDDFWAKPIPLDDLVDRVAKYLHGAAARTGGEPGASECASVDVASPDRMAVVVAEFVASLPKRARAIRSAIEGGDLDRARDLLHQLVGTGGIHGFMPISHQAARLLQIVKNGSVGSGQAELRELDDLIASLQPSTAHAVDSPPV